MLLYFEMMYKRNQQRSFGFGLRGGFYKTYQVLKGVSEFNFVCVQIEPMAWCSKQFGYVVALFKPEWFIKNSGHNRLKRHQTPLGLICFCVFFFVSFRNLIFECVCFNDFECICQFTQKHTSVCYVFTLKYCLKAEELNQLLAHQAMYILWIMCFKTMAQKS